MLFVEHAGRIFPELTEAIKNKLAAMLDQSGSAREIQERRDAWHIFPLNSAAWTTGTVEAWRRIEGVSGAGLPSFRADSLKFELVDNEVMENQILASRLALRLLDFASWELNDLRLRIQHLEAVSELHKDDIFRPEVLARHLMDQWTQAGLSRELWLMVQDILQKRLSEHFLEAYHAANEYLVQQGVMVEIDLRPLVKRTLTGSTTKLTSDFKAGSTTQGSLSAPGPSGYGAYDETRMQTATTPLARARQRAQGVLGQVKRILSSQIAGFDDTRENKASPPLAQALARMAASGFDTEQTLLADAFGQEKGSVQVEKVAGVLRQQTSTLKQAATTSTEKATIEIVALMFQSILAEDRIPTTVRVWFARLQMPVLRVAISEPEFFGSVQHPARRLIDRMGSCVMGFDAGVSSGNLEAEIKRVVQVIEQYPETGRRVFQLVYDEFQNFLSKFLSEQGSVARVVSVAQQVEQKETMVIQYTIEMRNMLNDMPVREEIREFLFKTWAEVLAIAAMRNGPQHQETITYKQAAADLVWAASAKPNRIDRAKLISDLPKLLQLLRLGMTMLNMNTQAQDENLKIISDTLADAFMSKTGVISPERIEVMTKRLANLEDYLSDEDVGDLPLDTESLVMMIGIDASDIKVITDGGSQPNEAMRAWALELQIGAWFGLDHNSQVSQVQFAWRSDQKQLNLFASADGRNFLIQTRRLAAYLQAGLLVPTEEEALTVRATRDAMAKLDANPERLLT